jgi:Spy/CpxP family protein refolding chaperone
LRLIEQVFLIGISRWGAATNPQRGCEISEEPAGRLHYRIRKSIQIQFEGVSLMLKRYVMTLVLALFAVTSYSFAQQDNQNQPSGQESSGQHRGGGRGWGNPAEMTKRLTEQLNLTSDQQTKVQGILEDQQKQRETLMQDSSLSQDDRRAKGMELRKKTMSDIRAVLTPDQQKQFDDMQARHEQEMKGGGGEGHKQPNGDQPKSNEQPK